MGKDPRGMPHLYIYNVLYFLGKCNKAKEAKNWVSVTRDDN